MIYVEAADEICRLQMIYVEAVDDICRGYR